MDCFLRSPRNVSLPVRFRKAARSMESGQNTTEVVIAYRANLNEPEARSDQSKCLEQNALRISLSLKRCLAANFLACFLPLTQTFPQRTDRFLEEEWLECKIGARVFWFEIPYGFTSNPTAVSTEEISRKNKPGFAPAMDHLGTGDALQPLPREAWRHCSVSSGPSPRRIMRKLVNRFSMFGPRICFWQTRSCPVAVALG
jgi:hypothetical protein